MRRCALLGVSPVDLVRDPVETARSINLLDFSPLNLPVDVRPRQPEYLIDLANAKLREGLRNTNYDLLMPLGGIANCLGVSKGFLNYRLGALCAEYARHRQKCAKLKSKEKIREAIGFRPASAHRWVCVRLRLDVACRTCRASQVVKFARRLPRFDRFGQTLLDRATVCRRTEFARDG